MKDQDRIEELRRRLYERGGDIEKRDKEYQIEKEPVEKPAPERWQTPPQPKPQPKPATRPVVDIAVPKKPAAAETQSPEEVNTQPDLEPDTIEETNDTSVVSDLTSDIMSPRKSKKSYRWKIIGAGLIFFLVTVAVSSFMLMSGGNTISGENITLDLSGPFTIGGGETIPLQIAVTNANSVPIQSATLIIEYPLGTQSASEEGGELFIERLSLDTIASGETLNVPLRAVVFGEENAEKSISAAIEYRVAGSNATFFKEAEPLRFKISSSPVVMQIESNTKISSGQETDITVTVRSNSQTALSDVLIKAEYPTGFDFLESNPEPIAGSNTWLIETLEPEGEVTIDISAIIVGRGTDELATHFSAGVANEQDPFTLSSIFTTDTINYEIEQPFLDVNFMVGRSSNGTEVVEPGQPVTMAVEFTNTLDDTLYDATITVVLEGNAVVDRDVEVPNGFYNSSNNTITWDPSEAPRLEQILPGTNERFTFTLELSEDTDRTPQIDMKVDVRARRVSEARVPEELIGTAQGTIKVASEPQLISTARYSIGDLEGSGPIPPVAEEETTYAVSLLLKNSTNRLTDLELTTSLPSYVTWENEYEGDGDISYNPTTRVITWQVSSVDADMTALTSFQVSILPSVTQIDTTPTLIGEQRLRASDQFTGSTVRVTRPAVTTELSTEAGDDSNNGRVQAP